MRPTKPLKTYIHIKSFPMEVAVESNIPQGFDMDDGGAAPIYRPDIQIEQEPEQQEEEQVQPIYYEIPMPKQERQPEIVYQQPPPPSQDTIFSGISPLIWMVIIFVAFILGFFMGMGSGGKGGSQAAPIILTTSGRNV